MAVLPLFYLLKGKGKRNLLLVASYAFYGYWDYRFLALLLISTVADFIIGQKLYNVSDPLLKKRYLQTSLLINLGILGIFKYYNFFVDSFDNLVSKVGGELDFLHLNILLPVGISFYTFQTMSYTLDIYNNKLKPTKNFFDFALFVAFFPQLVAGPIERATNLLPQIATINKPTRVQVEEGIALIIIGLFKKVMLGDAAGRMVDHFFAKPNIYTSDEIFAAILLFAVQLYADFSGYSSMARGTSKLLGVELMKNFEQPYFSVSTRELWRRWHISLSTWINDYFFVYMVGTKPNWGRYGVLYGLITTFLVLGLWHGANWTFVLFGLFNGIIVSIEYFTMKHRRKASKKTGKRFFNITGWIATFGLWLIGLVLFRSDSVEQIGYIFNKLIYWETGEYAFRLFVITATFLGATFLIDFMQRVSKNHAFVQSINNMGGRLGVLGTMFLASLLFMFQSDPMPFVYFQF